MYLNLGAAFLPTQNYRNPLDTKADRPRVQVPPYHTLTTGIAHWVKSKPTIKSFCGAFCKTGNLSCFNSILVLSTPGANPDRRRGRHVVVVIDL